jgi:DNA mismatch repair protein MutS2
MISEVIQLIESENSKRNKRSAILIKNQIILKKNIEFEVEKKIEKIRTEKKKIKLIPKKKSNIILKVGDDVRILDSKSIGTIDSIKKNRAIVNYGKFTTQVDIDQLEYVK